MVPSRSPADQISTNPNHHPVDSRKRSRPTSIAEEQGMDPSGLEPSLKRLRLSSKALSVINSSTSSLSEKRPYVQTTFIDWCEVRGIDHTLPSVFSVLNFLAEQRLLKNWKTSTVLTYASSILQLYTVPDQTSIRQSEEYILFCKNLKANTVLPLKSWDYDISPALNYLLSLGDNDGLPLEKLTAKTAWLLSMVGFLRPSDVERIDLHQCSVSPDLVLKLVIVAPKEKRQGNRITKAVTIHPHNNPLLCPVQAYQAYQLKIAHSEAMTPHPAFPKITINALFRKLNQHSAAIGHERISKHVQSIMKLVSRPLGSPIPKARALGSTLAAQLGISVDDIVVHGNWSSKDLFEMFYRISVTTSTDFTKVLTLDTQQRSRSKCNIM